MTNTKFRKRALLSSVAMLLVALVALGSATFAWFVDDPNASASGLNAKTNASTGLLISTDTDGGLVTYTHSQSLGLNKTGIVLTPATTKNGTDYFTTEALAANNSVTGAGKKWADAVLVDGADGEGVYHETISLKATTAPGTGKHYKLELTRAYLAVTGSMGSAVTIVLYDGTTAYYINSTGTAVRQLTGDFKTGTTFNDASETTTNKAIDVTATANDEDLATAFEIGSLTDTTAKNYEMYVFLDGYNETVKSMNATSAANIITGMKLGFKITLVDNT